MADNHSLLAHLALKLGSHPENIAVEALGHILSSSKAALRAIEDLLKAGGADIGRISHARTQASKEKRGRPDLSGCDENGEECMLIEAKFWAGLTENQPVTYLKRLPTDKPAALLFVAPLARFETLWDDLLGRVRKSDMYLGAVEKKDENLWVTQVEGKHCLMLTSWNALLESIAVRASRDQDSCVEANIRQLLGLTERMDKDAFLPLRSAEFGPEFPRRVLGLQRLTKDVVKRVRAKEWVDMSGLRGRPPWSWYMRLSGAGTWFGVSLELWARAQSRDTPLWVILEPWRGNNTLTANFEVVRRKILSLPQKSQLGIFDEGEKIYIPIDLPVGVEYDTVLDAVVKRLEDIARLIDSPDTTS